MSVRGPPPPPSNDGWRQARGAIKVGYQILDGGLPRRISHFGSRHPSSHSPFSITATRKYIRILPQKWIFVQTSFSTGHPVVFKEKVKQSRYKPGVAQRVPGS